MDRSCVICKGESTYKCPICLVFYCSAQCCKKHRENDCEVLVKPQTDCGTAGSSTSVRYSSQDTAPIEKLQMLRDSDALKELLWNPHLRKLLQTINSANDPETIMQQAMQEPLFLEFADVCLSLVEPRRD